MPIFHQQRDLDSRIMLCGGHVGRAHGKKLAQIQTKSCFSKAFVDSHKKGFPQMEKLKMLLFWRKAYVCRKKKQACMWLYQSSIYTECKAQPLLCTSPGWTEPW